MSLNVGALWVATPDRDRVVAVIRQYWTEHGAQPIASDPLLIEPLSLEETGQLGFAIPPPAAVEGQDGPVWTVVYDSERYHADSELAAHLARTLGVAVVQAEFAGATDAATVEFVGPGWPPEPLPAKLATQLASGKAKHWDRVEEFVLQHLPHPFVYFNLLRGAKPGELDGWVIFGFDNVPYDPDREYSGPSLEAREAQRLEALARSLAGDGDIAGLRDLYQREPDVRRALIDGLGHNVAEETERAVYLAFTEEILARGDYQLSYPLAEAAYRAGDIALFDRVCTELGSRVSYVEIFAYRLLQDGHFDDGVQVLARVCASPTASLTAWNNLAHALCQHSEPLPAQAAAWLVEAETHGPVNPHIHHNTACAWVRLGDRERALASVEAAVRTGYPLLDKLRTDEDLRTLFDEPRFIAAFTGDPGPVEETGLVAWTRHRGQPRVLARPLLTMHFFLEPDLATEAGAGPSLADLLEAYLADAPTGEVTHRLGRRRWKRLRPGRIVKHLARLRAAGPDQWTTIRYRGETDPQGGAPTPYGADLELRGRDPDRPDAPPVSSIRLLFPVDEAMADPDAMVARFRRYAGLVPAAAGGCGLELVLRHTDVYERWWLVEPLEERRDQLRGMQHHPGRDRSPGGPPGPSWLTLLGPDLVARLDPAALSSVDGPRVLPFEPGVCLRASVHPTAEDVGTLPTVGRLLRPLRHDETADHDGRLDDVADGPYDNEPMLSGLGLPVLDG